jgi:hypothetical protein
MKHLTPCVAVLLALALAAAVGPVSAGDSGGRRDGGGQRENCRKCPKPRPHYDSTEVIKQSKDVDHTRVIETQKVVPSKRLIETNHLIIHENETRHVGTVEHNHTIVEKELILTKRNVDHMYVNREIDLVQHKYRTERKRVVEEREIPGEVRHLRPRDKAVRAYGRAPAPVHAYGRSPKYVRSRH